MEPVVHYSQQDPLYASVGNSSPPVSKIDLDSGASASEIGLSSLNYGPPPPHNTVYGSPDYYKEPEPIIEIIIKESNESLPAPPPPPQPPIVAKAPKEPVQVFYVKYKKNPNSYGDKEDIIYEPPVPAITPADPVGESETPSAFTTEPSPVYNYVTGPPAPSTTYRTIIKPDSEVYHGTGLKVTFGKPESADWNPSADRAQNRDSASEASDTHPNKAKTNGAGEFKRSFVQPSAPTLVDYQRNNNNNFEPSPIAGRPQFDEFNAPNQNVDHVPQLQSRKPGQQVQNYFREDNPRPNFPGQIPVFNQQFKPSPQQNRFEGVAEQRPVENFRNQQQFNRPPNFQQVQLNIRQSNANQQFNHQQQPHNNPHGHQQFVNNNPQQLNNQHGHQQFNNLPPFVNQPRQPDFQLNPPTRNVVNFQERPVQNNERPFVSKPFENRPVSSKPFENRPVLDGRPFDNNPFESRPTPDRHFENRPFDNGPVQNRPFENQPVHSKPFENRPILFDRPFDGRPLQNRPIENRPIQPDNKPFDNNRQNQGIVNYRPHKPPTPQNIPLNPNPSFVPNDRRPTVPPPQLPSTYNTQPIGTKHTVDLAFSPLQQQQQHQQFQQQQLQQQLFQHQFEPVENRSPANSNPTSFQQPSSVKQQQFVSEINHSPIPQYQQQQQSVKQQQFNTDTKSSLAPQIQITPSNSFELEPKQQPAQSGQFIELYNKYSPTQTEKNTLRSEHVPWQVANQPQSSFKPQQQQEYYKERLSASTVKNTIDTTSKSISKTTEKPPSYVTMQYKERSTSTVNPVTTTTSSSTSTSTNGVKNITKTDSKNIASLPDEVPDELREQLLSSGILSNADIQILDYDKVGDIPIESLPPEALENLYGQGSAPVPSIVLPPNKSNVQMKVVKYDPSTEEGRKIENSYVDRPKSQTLDPVILNDKGYNRFLPLNINGTHFPIPDSPLLKNKAIASVVILSPVGYDLSDDQSRPSRNTAVQVKGVHFIVGDIVKSLVKNPNKHNFETWLEKEKSTPSDEQSVVLLVTKWV